MLSTNTMNINISNMLLSFVFFSIFGWILEVGYRSIHRRRFTNPGLLKGPYLPLYGTVSLILIGCISLARELAIIIKIFLYFFVTTGLEFISGLITIHLFGIRLWDYSDQYFQFKGYICLKFSIYWVVLAFVFEYLFLPQYFSLINNITGVVKGEFGVIVLLFMVIDFVLLVKRKHHGLIGGVQEGI